MLLARSLPIKRKRSTKFLNRMDLFLFGFCSLQAVLFSMSFVTGPRILARARKVCYVY